MVEAVQLVEVLDPPLPEDEVDPEHVLVYLEQEEEGLVEQQPSGRSSALSECRLYYCDPC